MVDNDLVLDVLRIRVRVAFIDLPVRACVRRFRPAAPGGDLRRQVHRVLFALPGRRPLRALPLCGHAPIPLAVLRQALDHDHHLPLVGGFRLHDALLQILLVLFFQRRHLCGPGDLCLLQAALQHGDLHRRPRQLRLRAQGGVRLGAGGLHDGAGSFSFSQN